jgi:hypothetical protein
MTASVGDRRCGQCPVSSGYSALFLLASTKEPREANAGCRFQPPGEEPCVCTRVRRANRMGRHPISANPSGARKRKCASNAAQTRVPARLLHTPSERATLASDVRGQSGPKYLDGPSGSRFRVISARRNTASFTFFCPHHTFFQDRRFSLSGSLSDRPVLVSYFINRALV